MNSVTMDVIIVVIMILKITSICLILLCCISVTAVRVWAFPSESQIEHQAHTAYDNGVLIFSELVRPTNK